ncbi:hypothetical protein [Pseudomonas laurentiana]
MHHIVLEDGSCPWTDRTMRDRYGIREWGTTVLDHWCRSDVADRDNLAMRGVMYNEDDIREVL